MDSSKLQYKNFTEEEIDIIKSFYSTETLNKTLVDFLSESSGLEIIADDLNKGALYYDGKIVLSRLDSGEFFYGDLYEETIHFVQQEIGIVEQDDGSGHSNIEFQAKVAALILSKKQYSENKFIIPPIYDSIANSTLNEFIAKAEEPISISQLEEKALSTYRNEYNAHYGSGDTDIRKKTAARIGTGVGKNY